VRVDAGDNVWIVDNYSGMVIKFDSQLRILMMLGRKPEAVEVSSPKLYVGNLSFDATESDLTELFTLRWSLV
jgi:RNA recognition motif-containing protein